MSEPICKTPVLKRDHFDQWFEHDRWSVCIDRVREHFYLPDEVNKVQFFGYTRPGKNRVRLEKVPFDLDYSDFFVDGEYEGFLHRTEKLVLKKMKNRKVIYVECEYE